MNLLFLDESDHASRPAEKKENDTPSSIIEDSEVLLPATQKSLQDTPASLSLQTQPLNQIAPHVTNPLVQSADSLEENYPIPFTQRSELSLHSRIKKVKHWTMNALATIGFVVRDFRALPCRTSRINASGSVVGSNLCWSICFLNNYCNAGWNDSILAEMGT